MTESLFARDAVALDVPPDHRRGLPVAVVSPYAVEAGRGGGPLGDLHRKHWVEAVTETAGVLTPLLEQSERVITACAVIRSPSTRTLVLTLGFAGAFGVRRHYLAVTDRRLLLLRHRAKSDPFSATRVDEPLAELQLLSFGPSPIRRDPTLVLRFNDSGGTEHRLQFSPVFQAEAHLVERLLRDPEAAATVGDQIRGRDG